MGNIKPLSPTSLSHGAHNFTKKSLEMESWSHEMLLFNTYCLMVVTLPPGMPYQEASNSNSTNPILENLQEKKCLQYLHELFTEQ
jgi:hypothetical protein